MDPRPAREVIDAAIRENRGWEYVCYGLVITFVLVGVVVIGTGVYHGNGLMALSGSVASALFWPALRYAMAIRRENMAIRLLEVSLTHAKTAEQAAKAIKDAFTSQFGKGKSNGLPKP
jgi:hypothetical protein